jgi:hypothetical protein
MKNDLKIDVQECLDEVTKAFELAQKVAKMNGEKAAAEAEKRTIQEAKELHDRRIKNLENVVSLLRNSYAIDAPYEKLKDTLDNLGKKYKPKHDPNDPQYIHLEDQKDMPKSDDDAFLSMNASHQSIQPELDV